MSSPRKNALPPTTIAPPTEGSPRRLRKLQSAHQLSSNYTALNAPSLISQQRQQQRNNPTTSQTPSVPPIPALHSPQKHTRPRASSDVPSPLSGPSLRRNAVSKKQVDAKDDLKTLLRRSPRGNLLGSLEELRYLILTDGLEADSDGMVCIDQ